MSHFHAVCNNIVYQTHIITYDMSYNHVINRPMYNTDIKKILRFVLNPGSANNWKMTLHQILE